MHAMWIKNDPIIVGAWLLHTQATGWTFKLYTAHLATI